MKKLIALFWGVWTLIKLRLSIRKKVTKMDSIVKKTFNFVGSSKRPHPGMSLFALDPDEKKVYKVPIIKNDIGSNGFLNPDHRLVWALNEKNAKKKFAKIFKEVFNSYIDKHNLHDKIDKL